MALENKELMDRLAKSKDFCLVYAAQTATDPKDKKKAMLSIWEKYHPLICKMQKDLMSTARENHWSRTYEFDDYESGTYERLVRAIETVDWPRLNNLKHPENWTFYQHFWGYLSAYNRDLRNKFLKRVCGTAKDKKLYGARKKIFQEIPMEFIVNEDEEEISMVDISPYILVKLEGEARESENNMLRREIINRAYKKFSNIQKNIWDLKVCGHTNNKVAEELKIDSDFVSREYSKMKVIVRSSLTSDIAESYSSLVS